MLTGDQLETLALTDVRLQSIFIGVYSLNNLPYIIRYQHSAIKHVKPICFIVNTDTTNLPGQHWIAIFIDENNIGEVFDSFGRLPPSHIQRWMNINTRFWYYSQDCIQSISSTMCGAFCLYYLFHKSRGISLQVILSHFDFIFLQCNDYIVQRFVIKLSESTVSDSYGHCSSKTQL